MVQAAHQEKKNEAIGFRRKKNKEEEEEGSENSPVEGSKLEDVVEDDDGKVAFRKLSAEDKKEFLVSKMRQKVYEKAAEEL
jgi:hypothetical protein